MSRGTKHSYNQLPEKSCLWITNSWTNLLNRITTAG